MFAKIRNTAPETYKDPSRKKKLIVQKFKSP
jgi:hypothetical protein